MGGEVAGASAAAGRDTHAAVGGGAPDAAERGPAGRGGTAGLGVVDAGPGQRCVNIDPTTCHGLFRPLARSDRIGGPGGVVPIREHADRADIDASPSDADVSHLNSDSQRDLRHLGAARGCLRVADAAQTHADAGAGLSGQAARGVRVARVAGAGGTARGGVVRRAVCRVAGHVWRFVAEDGVVRAVCGRCGARRLA